MVATGRFDGATSREAVVATVAADSGSLGGFARMEAARRWDNLNESGGASRPPRAPGPVPSPCSAPRPNDTGDGSAGASAAAVEAAAAAVAKTTTEREAAPRRAATGQRSAASSRALLVAVLPLLSVLSLVGGPASSSSPLSPLREERGEAVAVADEPVFSVANPVLSKKTEESSRSQISSCIRG